MRVINVSNDRKFPACKPIAVMTNEGYFGSYYNSHKNRPYFEYKIMNLRTNLSQRGNSTKISLQDVPFNIGDKVKGICCYDKKEHEGTIASFYKNEDSELVYIYILSDLCETIPLYPNSVKRIVKRNKGIKSPRSMDRFNAPYPGIF